MGDFGASAAILGPMNDGTSPDTADRSAQGNDQATGSSKGPAQDPGAYIGRGQELASESIRGGVRRDDERIAGEATQSTGVGADGDVPADERGWPEGHRQASHVDDDDIREAGQNR